MYRDLEDFWHLSRRYRLFHRISGLACGLLDKEHVVSEPTREALERLNRERIACQQEFAGFDLPAFAGCDSCGGACCNEPSERYFSVIDYWLRRNTPHEVWGYAEHGAVQLHRYYAIRAAAAWKRLASQPPPRPATPPAQPEARCSHLGAGGCQLPHAERPVRCLLYACPGLKRSLADPTRRAYMEGVKQLHRISLNTFNVLKLEAGFPPHYGLVSLLFTL